MCGCYSPIFTSSSPELDWGRPYPCIYWGDTCMIGIVGVSWYVLVLLNLVRRGNFFLSFVDSSMQGGGELVVVKFIGGCKHSCLPFVWDYRGYKPSSMHCIWPSSSLYWIYSLPFEEVSQQLKFVYWKCWIMTHRWKNPDGTIYWTLQKTLVPAMGFEPSLVVPKMIQISRRSTNWAIRYRLHHDVFV